MYGFCKPESRAQIPEVAHFYVGGRQVIQQSPKLPYVGALPTRHANLSQSRETASHNVKIEDSIPSSANCKYICA